MTITLRGRTLAVPALVAAGVVTAYLLGTAHAGGSSAAAATSPHDSLPVAAGSSPTTGVTVSGTGTASGTPDTLRLSLTVTTTGADVGSALDAANRAASAVQKSLRSHGVAAKDMQTAGLSITPNYTNKGAASGFRATESLAVTLHGMAKAGATVSAAVAAGGDAVRVDGVSLDFADTSSLLAAARDHAFAAARTKAEQYAKAAGRRLGAVVAVDDTVTSAPGPYYGYAARFAPSAAAAVPFQAGTQDVSVQVTVVFGWA